MMQINTKKVLIFYSKTGGGHLRSAQALADEINLKKGYVAILSDGLSKNSWGRPTQHETLFFLLTQYTSWLYDFFYKITDNTHGIKILRSAVKFYWGSNYRKIIEKENPDLIISTHHFISPATIQSPKTQIPHAMVVCDLSKPHRIWFDSLCETIIVPSKDMSQWAKKTFNISNKLLKPIGFPLRKQFTRPTQSSISGKILIIGSAIRSRTIKKWIESIQQNIPDKKISVVCGNNILLQKKLSDLKNVAAFGFAENLDELMRSSDIVIGKAGPGIIMEASALKKPIIITCWNGLQEKGNVNFVVQNNLGIYDPDGKNIVSSILFIYQNYSKFINHKNKISFDTGKIVNHLLTLTT